MCGRKTLTKDMQLIIEELAVEEWETPENYTPNYNITPTQSSPILIDNGKRTVRSMRWGLIPSWARDEKFGARMINARIETLLEKSSFRNLLIKNRCVVIADGYYEWKKVGNKKIPYYLKDPDNTLLPMAGLYDVWRHPEGYLIPSYTIITKEAQQELSDIHHRMPVILSQEYLNNWLKTKSFPVASALELAQNTKRDLEKYPISNLINSAKNNSRQCIAPIDTILK